MLIVPKEVRDILKKPLGKVYHNLSTIKKLSKKNRIICIGDICTLAMLSIGVKPYISVFDFKYMRKNLPQHMIHVLNREYKRKINFINKPGTISKSLLESAKFLIRRGGAIKIDGEEDLTALAFMKNADNGMITIYGQPDKGIVVVESNKKTRSRISKLIDIIIKNNMNKKTRTKNKAGISKKKKHRKKRRIKEK